MQYPPPYHSQTTPYEERDFSEEVKKVCATKSVRPRMAKVIVLGDVAVGKTSLVNRFSHKSFSNNYKATIGVDFEVERFDVLGIPFNLQIWDTAGQERFKCIAASYYRHANVIIVVFDLSNLLSLAHCQQWLTEASRCNFDSVHIFLVGTKRDLLSNKTYESIQQSVFSMARKMNAEYWAVSAKTGDGINEFFSRVAALAFSATILRELKSYESEPRIIGHDLISLKNQAKKEQSNNKETIKCSFCTF